MDNATRISTELLHEQASIWYVCDRYGYKIMIKVPSPSIRALIKRCTALFIFGKDSVPLVPIFHTAIRINDDAIHYLTISGVHRFYKEHLATNRHNQPAGLRCCLISVFLFAAIELIFDKVTGAISVSVITPLQWRKSQIS